MRKKVKRQNHIKLGLATSVVTVFSLILAFGLKHATEFFEHKLLNFTQNNYRYLFIFLPTIGITAIYFLRKHVFFNRKNKGISEVHSTLDDRKDHLVFF